MATTSTISYCSETDLLETFPDLSGFDLKRRLVNWQTTGTTNRYKSPNCGKVIQLYSNGKQLGADAGSEGAVTSDEDWYYNSAIDTVFYFDSSNNPTDLVMEAGKDWSTVKTDFIKKASRMVESLLDSRMTREISKNREGLYPEFIIRATSLKAIILLMRSHDSENSALESFEEEFKEIIEGYRSGAISLPNAVTADSSRGVIRTVTNDATSDLFPVELRGYYNGSGYELLKIKIESGDNGIIGTAKMTVYGKDTTKLKVDKIIDADTITGDFQPLGLGNLYIRWSGDNVITAICVANDEYEIELHGSNIETTMSQQGSIRLSRTRG